ncbi:hypothetical protein JAO78_006605 [Alishewanella sp. 16-MA]|uniref:DUF1566 domain-containing protein n=1 Tax=Alishewanella maricola TaxID=2795740 RepID=A0ABS8C2D1_9ALTE|nr:hypothetical protein [Alishewanella maricola]MCB5226482.1 hypothetical protein [Alishewanella maricola]
MLKKLLVIATLVAGLISTQASAAFVSTDWKNAGDGFATLDTETGLEWLDLTATGNKSIDQVKSELGTIYMGWRIPTHQEIVNLAMNLYPINFSNGPHVTINENYGDQGIQHRLFGANLSGYYYGLYEKNGQTFLFGRNEVNKYVWLEHLYSSSLLYKNIYAGVYLVSDGGTTLSSINDPTININNPNAPVNMADVSAPAGLAAAVALMLIFGARRKAA